MCFRYKRRRLLWWAGIRGVVYERGMGVYIFCLVYVKNTLVLIKKKLVILAGENLRSCERGGRHGGDGRGEVTDERTCHERGYNISREYLCIFISFCQYANWETPHLHSFYTILYYSNLASQLPSNHGIHLSLRHCIKPVSVSMTTVSSSFTLVQVFECIGIIMML